jgi:DNA-binding response OmpR family regulator
MKFGTRRLWAFSPTPNVAAGMQKSACRSLGCASFWVHLFLLQYSVKNFTLNRGGSEGSGGEGPPVAERCPLGARGGETRLLLVDSEILPAEALCESLREHGFLPTVVHSARAAWEAVDATAFDLVVLDAALAEGPEAGFELAGRLRDAGFRQLILFLTARSGLADRIRAYKHGDGFLGKPFELPELVAKLEALARRGPLPAQTILWGELELVPAEGALYRSGRLVALTTVEYQLVELFMRAPGRLFAYSEILERVWGAGYTARSNTLTVHIRHVRAKVGEKGFIEAVRGVGYRLREWPQV